MKLHAVGRKNDPRIIQLLLSTALTLKLNIFPVLVCETDPPAALHSHPFFDMRDCVPEKSSEDEWDYDFIQILQGKCFFDKLNRLLAIVELVSRENRLCRWI